MCSLIGHWPTIFTMRGTPHAAKDNRKRERETMSHLHDFTHERTLISAVVDNVYCHVFVISFVNKLYEAHYARIL